MMSKVKLLLIVVAMCLSLPVMAADPPFMIGTFEHGAVGDIIAFDKQTPNPDAWKLKIPDADGTSKISDKGVTDGTRSLEVDDNTGANAESFLEKGLWRMWSQLGTATYVSMDITLNNPGGNTTIPDQWFEVDIAFAGALTGWADVVTEKVAVPVPWSEKTTTLIFKIPEAVRTAWTSGGSTDGNIKIRKYHGAAGATFWIDNIQINFDELVPPENPRDLSPNMVAVDKDTYLPNQFAWAGPAWDAAVEPNIVSIDYDVDYYSKLTSAVTADDPNFLNPLIVVTSVNTADATSLAVAFAYDTSYFWRVTANTTWDSNDITGNWVDSGTAVADFDVLADDLAPVVSIPDASDNIITWLGNLPENGLAGTISDEQISTVDIDWVIISGPGIAPNTTKQSQQRGAAYTGDPAYNNLLQDWIGTDSRLGEGGVKTMYLTLSGLPAATYSWKSYHHDTDNQTGLFDLTIDGVAYAGNPVDITNGAALPFDPNVTKLNATITADGTNDVVLVFTQKVNDPVDQAFFVMNGFELTDGVTAPLMVDFGNNAATLQAGFADYTATGEVSTDFVPKAYSAFGTTVTVAPSWDAVPATAKVFNTTLDKAVPTARFETVTNATGIYTVRLTATDYKNQSASDTLTVNVAADPCAAAKATPGFVLNSYDRAPAGGDCKVDLNDFEVFAEAWLADQTLSATYYH